MAEGERNSGVQGDLEKELTCSVSRCSSLDVCCEERRGSSRGKAQSLRGEEEKERRHAAQGKNR